MCAKAAFPAELNHIIESLEDELDFGTTDDVPRPPLLQRLDNAVPDSGHVLRLKFTSEVERQAPPPRCDRSEGSKRWRGAAGARPPPWLHRDDPGSRGASDPPA
eukprot:240874-Prymnesium_polylepis.1